MNAILGYTQLMLRDPGIREVGENVISRIIGRAASICSPL